MGYMLNYDPFMFYEQGDQDYYFVFHEQGLPLGYMLWIACFVKEGIDGGYSQSLFCSSVHNAMNMLTVEDIKTNQVWIEFNFLFRAVYHMLRNL